MVGGCGSTSVGVEEEVADAVGGCVGVMVGLAGIATAVNVEAEDAVEAEPNSPTVPPHPYNDGSITMANIHFVTLLFDMSPLSQVRGIL